MLVACCERRCAGGGGRVIEEELEGVDREKGRVPLLLLFCDVPINIEIELVRGVDRVSEVCVCSLPAAVGEG